MLGPFTNKEAASLMPSGMAAILGQSKKAFNKAMKTAILWQMGERAATYIDEE